MHQVGEPEWSRLPTISFERSKGYIAVLLKATPKRREEPGADSIVWEHGRRNFGLRRDGILVIVCPTTDGSELSGIGVFNGSVAEVARIMDSDPAVQAGLFTYEIHSVRGFPGDRLPE